CRTRFRSIDITRCPGSPAPATSAPTWPATRSRSSATAWRKDVPKSPGSPNSIEPPKSCAGACWSDGWSSARADQHARDVVLDSRLLLPFALARALCPLPFCILHRACGVVHMICVAVTYAIKPGHEEDAAALFSSLTHATRAERGCRMYQAHRSTT